MQLLDSIINRDFSRGRIAKSVVADILVPDNAVANSVNVVFDEQIGGARVRKGTTIFANLAYDFAVGQNYQAGISVLAEVRGVNWYAQTYTPGAVEDITVGVRLKMIRTGTSVGNITAQIVATTAGSPNTTVLATSSRDGSEISTVSAAFIDFIFPATVIPADAATVYAIRVSYPAGDGTHFIVWIKDTAGAYAGGGAFSSVNSGASWAAIASNDFQFQVLYGLNTYYESPLGFFVGAVEGVVQSIAIFNVPQTGTGVIFYRDPVTGDYQTSDEEQLDPNARNRIAILNGDIFRVNGEDLMTNSVLNTDGQEWETVNCFTDIDGRSPSLVYVFKNQMIVSGVTGGGVDYASRIWFSSVVDPTLSPFITWSQDPVTGDFIDVNPDDGGVITGFSDASGFLLVFKNNTFYRTDIINKTVDLDNIYNVGAVSQEGIVKCLGLTYFYTGIDIRRTDGGFPEIISRIGISDLLEQVQTPEDVFLETDGLNVYVSFNGITIDGIGYDNATFKFSPRDNSWSVHNYNQQFGVSQLLYEPASDLVQVPIIQTWNGKLLQINDGINDDKGTVDLANNVPVKYFLQTHDLEMGDRSHTKNISDMFVVYMSDGGEGTFLARENDGDYQVILNRLNKRVNVGRNVQLQAEFFTFRWQGEANSMRPLLEGYHLPKVTDLGIIH